MFLQRKKIKEMVYLYDVGCLSKHNLNWYNVRNYTQIDLIFQLTFGAVLSAIYAILMLIVILGLLKTSIDQGFCSSTTIILVFVAIVFIISALAHPKV